MRWKKKAGKILMSMLQGHRFCLWLVTKNMGSFGATVRMQRANVALGCRI